MHMVHTQMEVAPGREGEFERIERRYHDTVRQRNGFVSYQILRFVEYVSSTSPERTVPQPPPRYIHLTGWRRREDQLAWTASPEFAAWRDSVQALSTGPIAATFYDTIDV